MFEEISQNKKAFSLFYSWYELNEYKNKFIFFNKFKELPFEYQIGVFLKFIYEQHLYITIIPECYTDGINWNYQITWYVDNYEKNSISYLDGTGMYGDNNEYPTPDACYKQAIINSFELIEKKPKNIKLN